MRAIDADALKDVIQQHDYPLADRLNSIDNGMFTLGIFQAIDEQPTISPDDLRPVVRGDWEDAKQRGLCRCSACKDCYIEKDYITQAKWRYCPNCGAKMEVGEDA